MSPERFITSEKTTMQHTNRMTCSISSIKPRVKNCFLPQNAPLNGTYIAVNNTAGKRKYKQLSDCVCPHITPNKDGNKTIVRITRVVIIRHTARPVPTTLCSHELSLAIFLEKTRGSPLVTSEQSKKNALVTAGLADYKLLEYGTALCWASDLNGGTALTLDQSYVKSNYAYKRDVADPVFKYAGNLMQYTNVLVGFTLDQCKDDIAMRPYMILEGPNGEQVTIYGGIVYRSIGYIAYQNRNAFTPGSDAYKFVWNIIHHVYGNQYDADYKG